MAARFQFPCPECGTTLRLQDRKLVGRTLPCPECQSELGLVDDRGEIKAVANVAELARTGPRKTKKKRAGSKRHASSKRQAAIASGAAAAVLEEPAYASLKTSAIAKGQSLAAAAKPIGAAIATPVGIGWTVAGTVAAVLVGSIWLGGADDDSFSAGEASLESVTANNDVAPTVAVVDAKSGEAPDEKPAPDGIALTPSEAGLAPVNPAAGGPSTPARPNPPRVQPNDSVDPPAKPPLQVSPHPQPIPPQPSAPDRPPSNPAIAPSGNPDPTTQPNPEDAQSPPSESPAQVLAKPEVVKVDIQAALSQKLSEYRLAKPVPLRNMLIELESMIGVPISIDTQQIRDTTAVLNKDVSVSLRSTTVGELLAASLKPVGLDFKVGDAEIVIVPTSN